MEINNYNEYPITADDEKLINDGIVELKKIIKERKLNETGEITPEILDAIYPYFKKGTWWSSKKRDYAVQILGIGLGYCFVSKLGYQWILIKDKLGEELSVKHAESNWTSFPFSSVRKRIRTSEKNFFKSIIDTFESEIKNKK